LELVLPFLGLYPRLLGVLAETALHLAGGLPQVGLLVSLLFTGLGSWQVLSSPVLARVVCLGKRVLASALHPPVWLLDDAVIAH
jgi:hypothetical protein